MVFSFDEMCKYLQMCNSCTFAETLPAGSSDPAFQQWVLYLFLAVSMVGNFVAAWHKITGGSDSVSLSPQPIRTMKEPEFITRREYTESISGIHAKISKLEEQTKQEYQDLTRQGEHRMETIRGLIHGLEQTLVERMDDSLKQLFHRINEHEQRVARIEGRLETRRH